MSWILRTIFENAKNGKIHIGYNSDLNDLINHEWHLDHRDNDRYERSYSCLKCSLVIIYNYPNKLHLWNTACGSSTNCLEIQMRKACG